MAVASGEEIRPALVMPPLALDEPNTATWLILMSSAVADVIVPVLLLVMSPRKVPSLKI